MPDVRKNIFNRKKLKTNISHFSLSYIPNMDLRLKTIKKWINFIKSDTINISKEQSIKGEFLNDIFSIVLGYKSRIANFDEWNLNYEQATNIDGKFSDGSLGFFTKVDAIVRAVIEIKDANTNLDEKQHRHNDTRTPVEQAFSYQHKTGKSCKWVIVSNFREIRLYSQSSSTEYEVFLIEKLDSPDEFYRFYFLMNCENLISKSGSSEIDKLYESNEADEQNISKKFYADFKQARTKLFDHLKVNNPDKPELLLLEKTQKLLDRFIFICFCEDNRLLPEKSYRRIVENANKSFSFSETKVWNELKGLFRAINAGSPPHKINKFNGGLFADDTELDNLAIMDGVLSELQPLTDYDFESDVDVNILGHIFEQSISDLEELKSGIEGKDFEKKKSKRKKDGIYYTPEYITKYIVENAISGWLEDRKKELGYYELPELEDTDIQSIRILKSKESLSYNKNVKRHIDFWTEYREKLMNIKVLDPACGSGAFLNQAFNYLYAEGQKVNSILEQLTLHQGELFELDKHILSNNIYGVDLNNESVEITRLSLWIKTANNYSELTALDNNIKCGNSLIDDPQIAGDKAFDWNKEFPDIMQSGGFDVVIGNPPWGATFISSELAHIKYIHKDIIVRMVDSFMFFIDKSFLITNIKGFVGLIIPDVFLYQIDNEKLRKKLLENSFFTHIINLGDYVFENVARPSAIIIFSKLIKEKTLVGCLSKNVNKKLNNDEFDLIENNIFRKLPNNILATGNIKSYNILNSLIEKNATLEKAIDNQDGIQRGISPDLKEAFIVNKASINKFYLEDNVIKKTITGGVDLKRYYIPPNDKYILYITKNTDFSKVPNCCNYILQYAKKITCREVKENKHPIFSLHRSRNESIFTKSEKIIGVITGDSIIAALDQNKLYPTDGLYILSANSKFLNKYLLALLNSKLFTFMYKLISMESDRTLAQIKPVLLNKLPVASISILEQKRYALQVDIITGYLSEVNIKQSQFFEFFRLKFDQGKLNTKLQNWFELSYKEFLSELAKAKVTIPLSDQLAWQSLFEEEKAKVQELKAKIEETDKKIDAMVYELYGLTEEEIKVVEGKEH